MNQKPNRLIHETSPYLQQHAYNPVDWYPWGQEALEKAVAEDKPILLSIGYAACHWCHVMEQESFEDAETAALMNELFINIKVDREERPDLDKTYQMAHYVLTRQGGGWPLTLFLNPKDKIPFFSGTYFPDQPRHGLPAFKNLLNTISNIYQQQKSEIKNQNETLINLLQQKNISASSPLNTAPLLEGFATLKQNFDLQYGGFGQAPKFPQPAKLAFILNYDPNSPMLMMTLKMMCQGGIYDQIGGGFYRYSVDERWEIPHFEKMLYDNAQLLTIYTQAAKHDHLEIFTKVCKQIARWAMGTMQDPAGGYYASMDADSDGHEGKYYVWDREEIKNLLSKEKFNVLEHYYGLDQPANFEGRWHLHQSRSIAEIAALVNLTINEVETYLTDAREKLLQQRSHRKPPFIDQKILTAWNSLMIRAMFQCADLLEDKSIFDSASRALNFVAKHLWDGKNLYVSYKDGKRTQTAFLDDYAFFIDALLTSLQFNWQNEYFNLTIALTQQLLAQFADKESGGFYFTSSKQESLLYRPKTFLDEALPAGNGVAAQTLLLLSHLTGEKEYLTAAENTLKAAWPYILKFPAEHCTLLTALQTYYYPPQIIIIRGSDEQTLRHWQRTVRTNCNVVFVIPNHITELPETLTAMHTDRTACAYVCEGTQCSEPIYDLEILREKTDTVGVRKR